MTYTQKWLNPIESLMYKKDKALEREREKKGPKPGPDILESIREQIRDKETQTQ